MFGAVEANGGGETCGEDDEDESPDRGAGIGSGGELVDGPGTAFEEYGGSNEAEGTGISQEGCSKALLPITKSAIHKGNTTKSFTATRIRLLIPSVRRNTLSCTLQRSALLWFRNNDRQTRNGQVLVR